jgi:predicted ATP-dependent serine protease
MSRTRNITLWKCHKCLTFHSLTLGVCDECHHPRCWQQCREEKIYLPEQVTKDQEEIPETEEQEELPVTKGRGLVEMLAGLVTGLQLGKRKEC